VVSSTPRPQFTPGKDPVPILQEAGWAPGPVWTGGKFHPHRNSIPDSPARNQSLSYPVHSFIYIYIYIYITTLLGVPQNFLRFRNSPVFKSRKPVRNFLQQWIHCTVIMLHIVRYIFCIVLHCILVGNCKRIFPKTTINQG